MADNRYDVFQSLTVSAVRHEDTQVHVEVVGRTGGRNQVTFHFAERELASAHCSTIREWQERGTPLTYVRRGARGVLLDDAEAFRRAFGDDLVF